MVKIYLDDTRPAPSGWLRANTAQECIDLLIKHYGDVEMLSLDHDLGACEACMQGKTVEQWFVEIDEGKRMPHCDHVGTGYKVVIWLEEMIGIDHLFLLPKCILVHSANPVGRERIMKGLENISRIRNQET